MSVYYRALETQVCFKVLTSKPCKWIFGSVAVEILSLIMINPLHNTLIVMISTHCALIKISCIFPVNFTSLYFVKCLMIFFSSRWRQTSTNNNLCFHKPQIQDSASCLMSDKKKMTNMTGHSVIIVEVMPSRALLEHTGAELRASCRLSNLNFCNMKFIICIFCVFHLPGNNGEKGNNIQQEDDAKVKLSANKILSASPQAPLAPKTSTKLLFSSLRKPGNLWTVRLNVHTTYQVMISFCGTNKTNTELWSSWDIWIWNS